MNNIILVIVSFSMFMDAVDATIINTAIPSMAHSLSVNPVDLKVALISYLMSLAIFIPISGWIADKFGTKKVFIYAVGIFTLSSIWCGMTTNLTELVIARSLQGFGGSLTMPLARLIIVRMFARHELVSKMSVVVMIAALGLMLGPVLGGLITTHFSWRWIFWVNIPIGLMIMLAAAKFFPPMPPRHVPKLDKFGFVLFGGGLASLTYGLALISESSADHSKILFIMLAAFGLLLSYALFSRKKSHPIVKIELLRFRTFRTSVLGNLLARIGFGGVPFLVPLFLQIILGYSPQVSGILLAPTALGVVIVKPLSIHILRLLGYKHVLIVNTFLVGLSLWTFSYISSHTSLYLIAFLTFAYGFFISLQFTAMNSLAYAKVPHEYLSSATSIMSTVQQLGQSFGVAFAAILLTLFTKEEHTGLTELVFHYTFLALGLITIFSVMIFLQLKKHDGNEMIAKPQKAEANEARI